MKPIVIVFIKLMGAAISGHWELQDIGTTRDYDTLARSLAWVAVRVRPWVAVAQKRHIFVSRSCLAAKMAAPSDSYKRANNQGKNVHI